LVDVTAIGHGEAVTYFQMGDDHLAKLEDAGLSNDAILLEVQAFNQCAKTASSGFLHTRLSKLIEATDTSALAGELVAAGFWEVTDDGYYVVNYLSHNLSGEDQELARAGARERQQRSRKHKLGDHSMCIRGNYCKLGEIEPANRSSNTDVTRDATRDITPIQDNAMQGNKSRSISIDSKDGATPDAPKGALGFAPNGGLVISDGLENWPHPYVIVDSIKCALCGREEKDKAAKHFNTDQTSAFNSLIQHLMNKKYVVTILHEIWTTDHQILFKIQATNTDSKLLYEFDCKKLDLSKPKEMTIAHLSITRTVPDEMAEHSGDQLNSWMDPIKKIASQIKYFNAEDGWEFNNEEPVRETEHWFTGESVHTIELGIGKSRGRPSVDIFAVVKVIDAFIKLPTPTPTEAPTEANTETNGEKND